jgi:U4/U6.U5 tri-snRNP-associated protein 2
MFISLTDSKIWCLPDNYEVHDSSLHDVKYNLNPSYTESLVTKLNSEEWIARSLEGTEFQPGCVGFNNLKQTDYANTIFQLLSRVKPIRDLCLIGKL